MMKFKNVILYHGVNINCFDGMHERGESLTCNALKSTRMMLSMIHSMLIQICVKPLILLRKCQSDTIIFNLLKYIYISLQINIYILYMCRDKLNKNIIMSFHHLRF